MTQRFYFIIAIYFLSFSAYSQNAKRLEITGNLPWLANGQKIILRMLAGSHGQYETINIDSAIATNGKFVLKANVENGPRFFFLYLNQKNDQFMHLFVGNEKISIEDRGVKVLPSSGYLTPYLKVTGSSSNTALDLAFTLSHLTSYPNTGFQARLQKIEETGYDKNKVEGLLMGREVFLNTLFFELGDLAKREDFNQFLPQFITTYYRILGKNASLAVLYEGLTNDSKNSYCGKIMKQMLESCIGQKAYDFQSKTTDGKIRKLSEITSSGKLTLLYFWSIDRPRAEMNAELSGFYRKYHDKGLNIVNVFTGTDSLQWKKAIEQDYLPWYQAADFKGMWDGIAKQYGFTSEVAPFTILIDSNGRIVDWLVSGALLQY